jgi:hypothetical protein
MSSPRGRYEILSAFSSSTLLETLTIIQTDKKKTVIYETQRYISMFTSSRP